MITIATAMKKLRQDHRLSQTQLAKAIGCSKNTIQNYEKGSSDPKWTFLQSWLRACGASPVDLVRALGLEVAFAPPQQPSDELPGEIVLCFGGEALRRAEVRQVGQKVALVDPSNGHDVVIIATSYDALLSKLPKGTEVFEGVS